MTTFTLDQLNSASPAHALQMLDGLYEHSPWIAEQALTQRPFQSVAHLKHLMCTIVSQAGLAAQLQLLRAHPELAGKAMVDKSLTAESNNEQNKAGLTQCTPEEFEKIQFLNQQYNQKFGFPFILAVRGPRGEGLSKAEIIATLERRVKGHIDFERDECLRNVHRIAEIRLNDKLSHSVARGNAVWDQLKSLASHSENPHNLTVTYLTPSHLACANQIKNDMQQAGCDEVKIDAVGNVVGIYYAQDTGSSDALEASELLKQQTLTLLTGSHYDTVRNAGRYDGRLGIYVPLACVAKLQQQQKRLPYQLEIVAFAEEEGQRYPATFLGSGALTGDFPTQWLDQQDASGITMRQAMQDANLNIQDIPAIKRDAKKYIGFVEVHIEQGPVLNELHLPLGVVHSINASVRYKGVVQGMASHAGTTPMKSRKDAAVAVAELMLYAEQRARQEDDCVATVGILNVPNGSINVVPGMCEFSLDLRAPSNDQRDRLAQDVLQQLQVITQTRGLSYELNETMRASAAPSNSSLQKQIENAVESVGLPIFKMPSGAGHDAMKLHDIMPQAMLFVRGENSGISHNPLESSTNDDIELAIQAFEFLLTELKQ